MIFGDFGDDSNSARNLCPVKIGWLLLSFAKVGDSGVWKLEECVCDCFESSILTSCGTFSDGILSDHCHCT